MFYEEQWNRLNEYQRAAVEDDSPACVVKANVGSGKTTVLIAKILYLHRKKQVPFKNMAVLTFTNKAAGEIKERLLALEPELPEDELAGFGTFHSVAMNYLKTKLDIEKLGWTKGFMVMEPEEELELALQLAKAGKLKIKYKNRLKKRLEQEYPAFLQGNESSRYQDDLFLLFRLLGEEKRSQNKMSFSDLIDVCTKLFTEEVQKPDWIIIDEVQDSDRRQIEFITALRGGHTKLFAVGDPNQLIYSWRGSVETMFYYLKNQFQAKELSLPVNYRSSATILEAAGRFLQYGSVVEGKRENGDKILVRNHYDAFSEAQYLSVRIKQLHEEGMEYGEIAIFYRLQNQSDIIEKVFRKQNIPYTVSLKKTLKDIPVLDWFVKVLHFSCSREDCYAAEFVLSHPLYGEGVGEKKVRDILAEEKQGESMLYDRMRSFSSTFCDSVLGSEKEVLKLPETEDIFEYFQLDRYLKPNAASYEEDRKTILQFCKRLVGYCKENKKGFLSGVSQFLNSSALYGIQILREDENPEKDKVRLMTLHASKGLEFAYVFIIGVNQGLIPLAGKGFEEEEERRLFFVGMTRAKEHLELSYYTNPGQPRTLGGPGRYLDRIPEHLVEWQSRQSPKEKQANLHKLRKAVQMMQEREEAGQDEVSAVRKEKAAGGIKGQRVRHSKYGEGILVSETELVYEAEFKNYGKKEFLKSFGELEILS